MRLYKIFIFFILLVLASPACAQEESAVHGGELIGGLLLKQSGGIVNWGDGNISAVSEVLPMQDSIDPARTRALALRQGGVESRKLLLDTVLGLHLDGSRTIGSIYRDDLKAMSNLRGFIQNSLLGTELMETGEVRVTASLMIQNGLSSIIIPPTIPFLSGIAPTISGKRAEGATLQELAGSTDGEQPEVADYSGIVIDARSLELSPVLLPVVYDGRGVGVYGPFAVSRDAVISKGLVSYMVDDSADELRSRVGNSPLRVIPVSTQGKGRSNLILTLEDGEKVRNVLRNKTVAGNCAVVILVSKADAGSEDSGSDSLIGEDLPEVRETEIGVSGGQSDSVQAESNQEQPDENEAAPSQQ